MNKQAIITVLITALAFASCRPTAQQTVADVAQPTDSTEAVTSADTLRLVITFAPVMLGQKYVTKFPNTRHYQSWRVVLFMYHGTGCKDTKYFNRTGRKNLL